MNGPKGNKDSGALSHRDGGDNTVESNETGGRIGANEIREEEVLSVEEGTQDAATVVDAGQNDGISDDDDEEGEEDVDTLGVAWHEEANRGGVASDSTSVDVSALTASVGNNNVPPRLPPGKEKNPSTTRSSVLPADGTSLETLEGPITLPPGAYRILGPGAASARSGDNDESSSGGIEAASENNNQTVQGGVTVVTDEDDVVVEGFVPEPTTPEELAEERLRREAQEIRRMAITLDESAVQIIPEPLEIDASNDDTCSHENIICGDETEGGGAFQRYMKSPASIVGLTLLVLLAIALGVAFGSSGNVNDGSSSIEGAGDTCIIENVQDRYDVAESIVVSDITSMETLENKTSPQRRALEWIVCEDEISIDLIDGRDPSTGILPKQAHGTKVGGDAGEAQVLRRYALATFFFATSEQGPWSDRWNFLSPDAHECSWHRNITSSQSQDTFTFGGYTPVGFVCLHPERSLEITLGDAETEIGHTALNIFADFLAQSDVVNLTGTLPPEIGHLEDLTAILLQNQQGVRGSIPSAIGNMVNLQSIAFFRTGPNFGGLIPSSLFTLPSLQYVTIADQDVPLMYRLSESAWEFPATIESKPENNIKGIRIGNVIIPGTIPSYISEFTSLEQLILEGNLLEGSIPDDFGNLTSLEYLNLRNNKLTGTLPASLGKLSNMTFMTLGKNNFQGQLPSWLGDLSRLGLLDLSDNKFTGTVPTTFAQLTSLQHVSLQNNVLNGSISAFESLDRLSILDVSSNSFSSTIPDGLFANSSDEIIADFGHNEFTGKLPETFAQQASDISESLQYLLSLLSNQLIHHKIS